MKNTTLYALKNNQDLFKRSKDLRIQFNEQLYRTKIDFLNILHSFIDEPSGEMKDKYKRLIDKVNPNNVADINRRMLKIAKYYTNSEDYKFLELRSINIYSLF